MLVSIYLLVNTAAYSLVTGSLSDWLRQHNRDKEVTDIVLSYTELLHLHHRPVLFGVIGGVSLHLLLSLLPWIISDMILIIFLFIIFAAWSFLSFFVGLLAAILFPFLGGLVLGVKIMMWRQVRSLYILLPQAAVGLSQYEAVHLHNDSQAARRKMSSIAESE